MSGKRKTSEHADVSDTVAVSALPENAIAPNIVSTTGPNSASGVTCAGIADEIAIDIENPRSTNAAGMADSVQPSSEKWDIVLADFGLAARVQNTKIQSTICVFAFIVVCIIC